MMWAAVLREPGRLHMERRPIPSPGRGEVLVKVSACGVCRTDLHLLDGELPHPKVPLVPGHEVVGTVMGGEGHAVGARVGVPWLGRTCGECAACLGGRENLCERALFTGYTRDGGFAEYAVADARFCFPLPAEFDDPEAAPLLCAGLIGYRALRVAGEGKRLGVYGFGAAAHLLAELARWQGREVFAFTRPGDVSTQEFARARGVAWAGGSDELPPEPLDAAILFAPEGKLVPLALAAVRPGGSVVCGGIHMSDLPAFPYALLWGERVLRSVANLTRRDAEEYLPLAAKARLHPVVKRFPLEQANAALATLRRGGLQGAAVLVP
jgi:propanol-preferring alcohol dehydrogenase